MKGIVDTMTREQKTRRFARDLAEGFNGMQYTPEEVDCEEEGATNVLAVDLFGTNQGPSAGILLAEELGFAGTDADEAGDWACDQLAEDVSHYLAKRYPKAINAYAFWEDNTLFAHVVL